MPSFKEGEDYYRENGKVILTEAYLLKIRNCCCYCGCRHCPWGYKRPDIAQNNPKQDDSSKDAGVK